MSKLLDSEELDAIERRLGEKFRKLVPSKGRADTVAGEITRAINRIYYRNYNDGDHLGIEYGKETVNAPARYLMAKCNNEVIDALTAAWDIWDDDEYEMKLAVAGAAVLDYLDTHPELETTTNTEDMWDYKNEAEDVATYEDEDEDDEWDEE